ncbi:MAG TPA: transposase [Anaerolineales bacterium]|nr:transposase [Anaerolineales bacterium]
MPAPTPLHFGRYYHIYNRGNNRENIFIEERNYQYFLRLWEKYIEPVAETYAYCLMRNHFHFLVRIKDFEYIPDRISHRKPPIGILGQQFSNLFNAYTRTINSSYQRTGALFQRPFKRVEVSSEAYLLRLITYLHQNPQIHGFVEDFSQWSHSSYRALLANQPSFLKREQVIEWFGDREHFEAYHQILVREDQIHSRGLET